MAFDVNKFIENKMSNIYVKNYVKNKKIRLTSLTGIDLGFSHVMYQNTEYLIVYLIIVPNLVVTS